MVSPVIDAKNWPKTMGSSDEYLRGHIGVKGVPFSCVVISEEAAAPSLYEPDISFLSSEYEMFERVPILEGGLRTVTFKTYMVKVWGLISVITINLDFWTYFKSDQRTRYGRNAYHDLWDHFLRPDNVDNMEIEAERLFVAMHYSGERKRFNFERHVRIQKNQYHTFEGLN